MQFLAVSSSLIAVASAAAIACPANLPTTSPKGNFVLQVTDTAGKLDSGYFIRSFHIGAGHDSLVTTSDRSRALKLTYSSSDEHITSIPDPSSALFSVVVDKTATVNTPAGYGSVSFDVAFNDGADISKFTFGKDLEVQFDASQKTGTTFAVCPEVIDHGGSLDFLTVRSPGVKLSEKCADVVVKAIAV